METILSSKKENAVLETRYNFESHKFEIYYTINNKTNKLDEYSSISEIIERHEFWAKVTGVHPRPIEKSKISDYFKEKKHLFTA